MGGKRMNEHFYDIINKIVNINSNLARSLQRFCSSARFVYFCGVIKENPEAKKKVCEMVENLDVDGLKLLMEATLVDYRFWTQEKLRLRCSELGIPNYKLLTNQDMIISIESEEVKNAS